MTITRPTRGAISLSTSSHFPLSGYSKLVNPVMFPPRLREAFNEALADRIDDEREHDWYRGCQLVQCSQYLWAIGQDHVGRQPNKFCRVRPRAIEIGGAKAIVDMDVAAGYPSQHLKSLLKCRDSGL